MLFWVQGESFEQCPRDCVNIGLLYMKKCAFVRWIKKEVVEKATAVEMRSHIILTVQALRPSRHHFPHINGTRNGPQQHDITPLSIQDDAGTRKCCNSAPNGSRRIATNKPIVCS